MFGHLSIMKHSQGVNIYIFVKQNKSAIVQQKCCNLHGCLISKVVFLSKGFVWCYQAALMLTDGAQAHYMCVLIPNQNSRDELDDGQSAHPLWFR